MYTLTMGVAGIAILGLAKADKEEVFPSFIIHAGLGALSLYYIHQIFESVKTTFLLF